MSGMNDVKQSILRRIELMDERELKQTLEYLDRMESQRQRIPLPAGDQPCARKEERGEE